MANVFRDHGIERRLALSASYLRNLVFRLSGQDCVDIRLGRSRSKSIAVLFRPGLSSTTCPSAIQHRAARKPTPTLISEFHDMFEVFKKWNRNLTTKILTMVFLQSFQAQERQRKLPEPLSFSGVATLLMLAKP